MVSSPNENNNIKKVYTHITHRGVASLEPRTGRIYIESTEHRYILNMLALDLKVLEKKFLRFISY